MSVKVNAKVHYSGPSPHETSAVKAKQMCSMGQRLPQKGKNSLWFKGIKFSLLWSEKQCNGRTQINVGWIKTSSVSSNSICLCCFTAWDMWSGVAFCIRWQLAFLKIIWSIPRWHFKLQTAVPFKIAVLQSEVIAYWILNLWANPELWVHFLLLR